MVRLPSGVFRPFVPLYAATPVFDIRREEPYQTVSNESQLCEQKNDCDQHEYVNVHPREYNTGETGARRSRFHIPWHNFLICGPILNTLHTIMYLLKDERLRPSS